MKCFLTLALLIAIGTSCKPKILSGVELQNKLIETMQKHLDKEAKPGAQFRVQDVNFYVEVSKKSYDCEFHVNMHTPTLDTVGIMKAVISNDFKKVDRRQ